MIACRAHPSQPAAHTCARHAASIVVSALALGTTLAALACAPARGDAYMAQLASAKRAQSAGRFREAATSYVAAGVLAKVHRDSVFCTYIAGVTFIQAADYPAARRQLAAVQEEPYVAQAHYYLATLAEREGDTTTAQVGFERVVTEHANHGVARSALYRVLAHRDAAGERGSIAWIAALEARAPDSELAEVLAYQRGKREQKLGDLARAKATYLSIAERFPYPHGVHFDDALALASKLEQDAGNFAAAIALLERMLKERETAEVMGTYERPRFAESALRIAELQERMGDPPLAARSYETFASAFPTSTKRDDALMQAARIYEQRAEPKRACEVRARLVALVPDSKFVPCCIAACAAIARPKASKAPALCRDYLRASPQLPGAAAIGEIAPD